MKATTRGTASVYHYQYIIDDVTGEPRRLTRLLVRQKCFSHSQYEKFKRLYSQTLLYAGSLWIEP